MKKSHSSYIESNGMRILVPLEYEKVESSPVIVGNEFENIDIIEKVSIDSENFKKCMAHITATATRKGSEATVVTLFARIMGLPLTVEIDVEEIDLYYNDIIFEFKFSLDTDRKEFLTALAQCIRYHHDCLVGLKRQRSVTRYALVFKNAAVIIRITQKIADILNSSSTNLFIGAASNPSRALLDQLDHLSANDYIVTRCAFNRTNDIEDLCNRIHSTATGKYLKTFINEDTYKKAYENWYKLIGHRIEDETSAKRAAYFIEELVEDNRSRRSVYDSTTQLLTFTFRANYTIPVPKNAYDNMWYLWDRHVDAATLQYIQANKDTLTPLDERRYNGEFYTPPSICRLAIKYLEIAFPGCLQDPNTYIWDPCAGGGNLELQLGKILNERLILSSKDDSDILQLKGMEEFKNCKIFKMNFLNESVLDADASDDIPASVKRILMDKEKRLIILMNPPYAEAGNNYGPLANKIGVSKTTFKEKMIKSKMGKAANELFVQFIYKVVVEYKKAKIAVFSKIKYINSPDTAKFREEFHYEFKGGFLIPSTAFQGVTGKFPIAFAIWDADDNCMGMQKDCTFDVYNLNSKGDVCKFSEQTTISDTRHYINDWIQSPSGTTKKTLPLSSAVNIAKTKNNVDDIFIDAFGYARLGSNAVGAQRSQFFVSATIAGQHGVAITKSTFEKAMISLAIRRVIDVSWINDRDNFQIPTVDRMTLTQLTVAMDKNKTNLPQSFITDCVVYILFTDFNHSSAFVGKYEGVTHTIDNEFFPFSIDDVKTWAATINPIVNSTNSRNGKETFVYDYISTKVLSTEAENILKSAKKLYKCFYKHYLKLDLNHEQCKLNDMLWNPGYYQIRNALNPSRYRSTHLEELNGYLTIMKEKLTPQIYEFGMLDRIHPIVSERNVNINKHTAPTTKVDKNLMHLLFETAPTEK